MGNKKWIATILYADQCDSRNPYPVALCWLGIFIYEPAVISIPRPIVLHPPPPTQLKRNADSCRGGGPISNTRTHRSCRRRRCQEEQ